MQVGSDILISSKAICTIRSVFQLSSDHTISGLNSMNEKKTLNRFAYVDTLRALAALYVLFYHLALLPNPDLDVPYWAKRVVLAGGTGVTLFFVVSAFTLCYLTRARSDDPDQIYGFYVRRIFRIVPLFYVWMVISY